MQTNTEITLSNLGLEWVMYYAYHIHGYLSFIVCIIGTIGNILNVMVFTRKRMISPINIILASLAIVDLVGVLSYYYKAWYFYLKEDANPYIYWYDSYQIAQIMLSLHHTYHISFNTSVWLTVLASMWKCNAITDPFRNRIWSDTKTACKSISFVFTLCMLFYLLAIITKMIYPITSSKTGITRYILTYNSSNPSSVMLNKVEYFIHTFIFRIMPPFLIAVYSAKLISAFLKMKKDRKKLSADANTNPLQLKSQKQIGRTTLTLIILSVLSFITQLPQGMGALSSYYISQSAYFKYEQSTKEFIIILDLIQVNSAFNFFIYYFTSIQFRETFNALFGIKNATSNKQKLSSGNQKQRTQP